MLMYLTSENQIMCVFGPCPPITLDKFAGLARSVRLVLCLLFLLWRFSCHHFFR